MHALILFLLHEHWRIVCAWFEGWAEYWRKTGRDFPSVMIRLQKSKLSRAWNGTSQWPCGPLPPKALRSFNIQLGQEEMPDCWCLMVDLLMMDDGYAIWLDFHHEEFILSSLITVLLHAVLLRCCPIIMTHFSWYEELVYKGMRKNSSVNGGSLKKETKHENMVFPFPIPSMYGIIYIYIYHKNQPFMYR